MKYAVAALAAALGLAVAGNVVQALPDSKPAAKYSYAYQRIDKMLHALQTGDYKKACEVLAWYSLNQAIPPEVCIQIMGSQYKNAHMVYKMVGDTRGHAHYAVVTALMAVDDPATKVDEPAVCAQRWADGKDCKYAGVYTFGTALYSSPDDAYSAKKHPVLHWYVMWVD